MKISKPFNIKVGDKIVFLNKTDSSFEKYGKYKILSISKLGDYPFNEAHQNELATNLDNPKMLTIKDKNDSTFFLIYTDIGFLDEFSGYNYNCNYEKFDIENRLRKEKLNKIEKLNDNL